MVIEDDGISFFFSKNFREESVTQSTQSSFILFNLSFRNIEYMEGERVFGGEMFDEVSITSGFFSAQVVVHMGDY